MAATNINENLLNRLRQHIVDSVSYGRYRIGSTWYRAEINSKGIQSNGSVYITFYIRKPTGSSSPANRFRLMSSNSQILAERIEDVSFAENMETILYRFKFGVSVGNPT